jgi:uncharacterized protein (DUF1015 family)
MADISVSRPVTTGVRPFHGIRYDTTLSGDLASVLCPPYDIISERQQRELYARSPYNMIRLEYPLPPAAGTAGGPSKYEIAGRIFREWMQLGVLRRDVQPAMYVHDHAFRYRGTRHVRRGLVARVRLHPWYEGVYPHEMTATKAKEDRLQLMRACRASCSGPLGLYEDRDGLIAEALERGTRRDPLADIAGDDERHVVWAIDDPGLLTDIETAFCGESIYVADGHHRYETALVYQEERRAADPAAEDDCPQAHDHIVMTLTGFSDPGLFISPVYRVLAGAELPDAAEIESRLGRFFTVDYVPMEIALARSVPVGEMALMAVVGLRDGMLAELRQRPGIDLGSEVPGEHSSEYRNFNVSILNHVVMSRLLGVNPDGDFVSYSPDLEEVVGNVQRGRAQVAFLLAPPRPSLVKGIADQTERMPRKSTYFYPKPPTGLVVNPLID